MKRRSHLAAVATITVLLGVSPARSQDALPMTPPPPPPAHLEDVSVEIGHQVHQPLAQARRQLENPFTEVQRATGELNHNAVATTSVRANLTVPGAMNRSSQSLLIRTHDLDPESQSQLEEDLNVMSRILEKIAQSESTRGPRAMGINLVFGPGGSSVRSLYLDGFGALFIVNVNFPLLPLPIQDKEKADDSRRDAPSTWEQTREELYGAPTPPEPLLPMGWFGDTPEALAYDSEKVDRLRQDLIEAIKNATNMRQLAGDESVTICVQGAPAAPLIQVRRESTVDQPGGRRAKVEVRKRYETVLQTGEKADATCAVMTLRASKTDIDRFARGELTHDQFQELARTQTYPVAGSWNPPNPLFWYSH